MGAQPGIEVASGRLVYTHNGGRFVVTKPIDGKPATHANGGTIGFLMSDAKQAEAWHNAGVANGGTSIEDLPGVRANGAYLAYLRDPPMTTSSLGSPGLIADSKKLRRAVLSKLTPIFRCSKSPFP
jgi:hypothetical protein